MAKRKFISFIISICLLLPMVLGLAACGSDNIELSKTEMEIAVGGFEGFNFKTSKKYEIKSSDESIAIISSSQRGTSTLSDYVFATVKGISNGECDVTVKVGSTTETIKVAVGFMPEITVQATTHYNFNIRTNFPVGTKLEITLDGNGFNSSQVVTLEKQSIYSRSAFTFGEDMADGTYKLTVKFDDFANQPEEAKSVLGASGEYVFGEQTKTIDGVRVFEATYTIELPWLTTEEKIAATEYTKLTTEQKKYIKKWIDARYDYYDEQNGGKYQGDKYTNTIFAEAVELFNKTRSQIDAIWFDSSISIYN